MAKLCSITSIAALGAALGAALAAAGCSNVLGLKDPTFQDTDAAIDAPIDMGPAACMPSACPFGCDAATNDCRPAKLWVFLTTGSYFGDGIGGRSGADAKCLTASQAFPARACTAARTHAILTVDNNGDAIPDMQAKYMIPITVLGTATPVEVHRADDDVLVANNWNDLVAPSKAPITDVASATSATSDAAGVVWTGSGAGASNCTNWSTKVQTVFGAYGRTRNPPQPATWLSAASDSCNLLHRLLCVCWSGG